ncbi:MAG: ribosomal RNA small subunit methyltransferase A [Acidobacteriales bacterium]|nr:ribosomal RNA small subunit methyltransferase A [Terriglobales bacterium]
MRKPARLTRPPKLGQNFLNDTAASRKIVDALGDVSRSIVIEIGPGKGAMTRLLQERASKLIAIEYDRQLAAMLQLDFCGKNNIEIVQADIRDVDLRALLRGIDREEPVRVVGNLPYYITSDILLKLLGASDLFTLIVVMVQKEVADRLAASPGSRDYGLLSATAQMHGSVRKLFELPPTSFTPPPQVHSAVVEIRIAPRFPALGVDATGFDAFLKLAFAHKRKTIMNNLRAKYGEPLSRNALEEADIKPAARAESLTLEQMAALYRQLSPAEG